MRQEGPRTGDTLDRVGAAFISFKGLIPKVTFYKNVAADKDW